MKKILLLSFVFLCFFASIAGAEEHDVIRIGIARFQSRADGVSEQQAAAVGDIFARMLTNSKYILITERDRMDAIAAEYKLSSSGMLDARTAVEVGKILGCQYVLLGSVTNLSKKEDSTSVLIFSTTVVEASVTIDVRIINVKTSEVVLSLSETGAASQKGSTASFYGIDSNKVNLSGVEASAISEATSRLGFRVREALTGDYAQILTVGGRDVTLNVGTTSGVHNGDYWRVYIEGEEIHNIDGTLLGRRMHNIAVVKISDVQNDFSVARVPKGGGNISLIKRGDKIQMIKAEDAESLIKQKSFPTSRPRERLGNEILQTKNNALNSNHTTQSKNVFLSSQNLPSASSVTNNSNNTEKFESASNNSTDPEKIIPTYGLSDGETNIRRIAHINALKAGNNQLAYDKYSELFSTYDKDYLAAYQAGIIARNLGMKNEALLWFDKALAVNPNYQPAKYAKENLNSYSEPQQSLEQNDKNIKKRTPRKRGKL